MAGTEKGKHYKVNWWVNPMILSIFLFVRFGVAPVIGWRIDATFAIVWFALFAAVLILVNYFLYSRWKASAKIFVNSNCEICSFQEDPLNF